MTQRRPGIFSPRELEQKVGHLMALARMLGYQVRTWSVAHNLRGCAAGQARLASGLIRFNAQLAEENWPDFLATVVPHEVAHLIAFWSSGCRDHGAVWRAVMRDLGAEPHRCHRFDTSRSRVSRQRLWPYACGCSRTHQLSTTRHNRVLRQRAQYHCRGCGEPVRYMGNPTT